MPKLELIKKLIAFLGILVLFLPFIKTNAENQNSGLTISPAIIELNLEAGKEYSGSINLQSYDEQKNYTLFPKVQTFTSNNEDGKPTISEISNNSPTKNWISFIEQKYTLKNGLGVISNFKIDLPSETEAGGYYFALTYTTENQIEMDKPGIHINQEISTLLFISVKGQTKRDVNFDYFKSDMQIYDPFLDGVGIDYRIDVVGNDYLKPSGNIYVGSDTSKPENKIDLNPNKKIILPGSGKNFKIVSSPSLKLDGVSSDPQTNYNQAEIQKTNNITKPWVGYQTFTANISYINGDGGVDQKTAVTKVFFLPWKTLVLLVIGSFVILGIYKLLDFFNTLVSSKK